MSENSAIIFYDGHCGLCHGLVRFAIVRDHGAVFRYAPLQGELFQATVPPAERAALPDSIVLHTPEGALLIRSEAVIYVGKRLGGVWGLLAVAAQLVPQVIRDWLYNVVARVRGQLFDRPADMCPMVPPELRERLLR
jgi:predicted DCC family thiol-disulfide oxidoreductase YuxK